MKQHQARAQASLRRHQPDGKAFQALARRDLIGLTGEVSLQGELVVMLVETVVKN